MIGAAPSLSVSDFVAVFNQSLDMLYPEVIITGELSNFRVSKGMWVYFDLKDEQASVKFFGTVRSLPGPLEDGMMVQVVGRPYLHPKFGFSVQIDSVQPTGEGAIHKAQKLLAEKLQKEGLFDESRKRTIAYPPSKIAIVSSAESAGYGDFIKVIQARWPRLVTKLYDVQVQGADAPSQIVGALEAVNQISDFDAVAVIRGGGSRDDLAAFDHELVVRAIAASRTPTVVAIGHERDVCLSELAADMRASTPSNAAELLVPNAADEMQFILQARSVLDTRLRSYVAEMRQQHLRFEEFMSAALLERLQHARQYTAQASALLRAYDPLQLLQRGYAVVRNAEGQMLRTAKHARKAGVVNIQFKDGAATFYNKEQR